MELSKKQYNFIENIVFQKIYESYQYFIASNSSLVNIINKIDKLIELDIEILSQENILSIQLNALYIEQSINDREEIFKNNIRNILDTNRNIKKLFESAILLDLMDFFHHKFIKDENELYDICYAMEKKFSYNLSLNYLQNNFSYENLLLFTDRQKENVRRNLQKILNNVSLNSIANLKKHKINYGKAGKNFAALLKSDYIAKANILDSDIGIIIQDVYEYIDILYLKLWTNPLF